MLKAVRNTSSRVVKYSIIQIYFLGVISMRLRMPDLRRPYMASVSLKSLVTACTFNSYMRFSMHCKMNCIVTFSISTSPTNCLVMS